MTATVQVPGFVTGTWTIDPVHTYVGFIVTHLMVSKVRGRFNEFSGTITTGSTLAECSAAGVIQIASVDTNNETRDKHIRSTDFFDAENFPTMNYQSTGLRQEGDRYFLDGDLTVRGVTRPITLELDAPAFGPTPKGGTKMGLSAHTEINRMDYGVNYNGPIPGGGVTVSERVQLVLDIEAELDA